MVASDFFSIVVAVSFVKPADAVDVQGFVERHAEITGTLFIPHIDHPFCHHARGSRTRRPASFYSRPRRPGKFTGTSPWPMGAENFITEVSMDETDSPQTPPELLIILAALADQNIPIQTIAPKFTGRVNKGVDFVGEHKTV